MAVRRVAALDLSLDGVELGGPCVLGGAASRPLARARGEKELVVRLREHDGRGVAAFGDHTAQAGSDLALYRDDGFPYAGVG